MNSFTSISRAAIAALFVASAALAESANVLEHWETDRAQIFDAQDVSLDELEWIARPLVVFADTPNDPRFQQQMDLIAIDIEELALRDVIVITDTDPGARSDIRLELRPRGYMMALLSKDGRVAFRKPTPWNVREISRSIDKMPLRQQEIEDRRLLGR
ncbi:DUF4174 domain-containing protein [Yoonia sp. 2307UL14-13]|uniref:DUF4174 domain-containing protein n=1 Tax=Yoonia sp. 2307UL14-13 TaxID=3126506 RepID=UPI0030B68A67